MANWDFLKSVISDIVKENGNQEITGKKLNEVLNNIISNLGENATYIGIAEPTTSPGSPDGNVFYIARSAGAYSNFDGIQIDSAGLYIIQNKLVQNQEGEFYSKWILTPILIGYADTFSQNPVASSESNGLMSAEDKMKLDSVDSSIVRKATIEYYDYSVTDGPSRINTRANIKFLDTNGNQLFNAVLLGAGDGYPGLLSLKNKTKLDGYADTFSQNLVASSESNGLMSAEDKMKLDSVGESEIIDLPWDDEVQGQDGYINNFTERGEYHIHGERLYDNDGLPILNAASGHTIDGLMTVLDSSLPNGNKYDVCVTQILRLNNRVGGDGHIYVRTGIAATKSELQRSTAGGWSPWEKLMGVFEKNVVSNATDLDKYTSSGIYDGMFVFSSASQVFSGLKIESGSTFLMIAVNGYAVAQTGVVPQITQLLYILPSGLDGSHGVRPANVYIRTGIHSPSGYIWNEFTGFGGGGASSEELNAIKGRLDTTEAAIQSEQAQLDEVRSAAITDISVTGDKDGVKIVTENTLVSAGGDIKIPNADPRNNTAGVVTSEEINALYEIDLAAADVTNIGFEKDAERNKITLTGIGQLGDYQSNEIELTPATSELAGLMSAADKTKLDNIEARIDPDIAGRVWNEDNGTPKAESYYGSVKALRDLPKRLGLGRYLVKDDRTRRKLDPNDSTKYLDGTHAALDGTDGQCMWCWEGFYANIWHEGSRLIKAVTFDGPVGNDISIWIPAGGISWLGAGVMDRENNMLCSVISDDKRYRGGSGTALDASKYSKAPADTTPQITMLGMPATMMSTTQFGEAARRRGEGWEANWFVARFVVEFLFEVIMGTENSQEAFNNLKDANGLYQGGFGTGVTNMPDWANYNGSYPVIPTSVGLEAGDGVCLVPYILPQTNGVDGDTYKTFSVPVFFGLVGAGFGMFLRWVRGLIIDVGDEKSPVYVAPSMYAGYEKNTVEDKIMVAECTRVGGYITRKSYRGLCCIPTEVGGSANIRYSDTIYTNPTSKGLRVRSVGGSPNGDTQAGISNTYIHNTAEFQTTGSTSPLCYFTEDPVIPDSQSIANN